MTAFAHFHLLTFSPAQKYSKDFFVNTISYSHLLNKITCKNTTPITNFFSVCVCVQYAAQFINHNSFNVLVIVVQTQACQYTKCKVAIYRITVIPKVV